MKMKHKSLRMNETELLLQSIIEGIQEKKGKDIVVADLKGIDGAICQYFVICQGNSPTQVDAITESVYDMVYEKTKDRPTTVNGLRNAQWVGMDYGSILVHIFLPELRNFYNLEHLWADSKLTQIPNLD
jgi:ribosome-associated protein